jgi:bacterioferritin
MPTTARGSVIDVCDGVDRATQDMVIEILRDEEGHMRESERYLSEFEE